MCACNGCRILFLLHWSRRFMSRRLNRIIIQYVSIMAHIHSQKQRFDYFPNLTMIVSNHNTSFQTANDNKYTQTCNQLRVNVRLGPSLEWTKTALSSRQSAMKENHTLFAFINGLLSCICYQWVAALGRPFMSKIFPVVVSIRSVYFHFPPFSFV